MFESLRSLSDHKILSDTDAIVVEDRKLTLRLLIHLHEIERRKLYLTCGYSSMFVYCTSRLRLSEPAAARRLRTARCLSRVPELYALLESGEVNLSTVSMVSRYMKPESAAAILLRIRGKSRREVERIVAELEPRSVLPPDRVRVVVVAPALLSLAAAPRVTVAGDSEKAPTLAPAPENRRAGDPEKSPSATVSPVLERRALIQFTAGEDFLTLVERVRSIASHRLRPNATFEQVFALAMREYMKREDPEIRHKRREAKQGIVSASTPQLSSPRQIPAAVRDQVFVRDRGRCAFVAADGQRCDSARHVQVDHIRPVARGGPATIDNLRVLCAHHNRLESERLMGTRPRR